MGQQRRVWQDSRGTVYLRDSDLDGDEVVREFWVGEAGGYVYEVSARHHGTSGQQVCTKLGHRGYTLTSTRGDLLALIRREYYACRRFNKKLHGGQ